MHEDALLEDVIARLGNNPNIHTIFLVDSKRRFTGIVRRSDLMKWARFHFFGDTEVKALILRDFYHYVGAAKGKELRQGNWQSLPVKESDTLQTALDRMISYEEDVIPVVDTRGRILGDVTLSEVFLKAIEVGKQ